MLILAGTIALSVLVILKSGGAGVDLSEVRADHWDESLMPDAKSWDERVLQYLGVLAIVVGSPVAIYLKARQRVLAIFAIVALGTFGVRGLLSTGGRFDGTFVLLAVIGSSLLLSPNLHRVSWRALLHGVRLRMKPILVGCSVLAFFYVSAVVVMKERSRWLMERDIDEMLWQAGGGQVSDSGRKMIENFGVEAAYLIFSTGYFTRPVFALDFFLVNTDVSKLYLLGQYNFRAPLGLIGFNEGFRSARTYIASIRSAADLSVNPWATAFRDYMLDWGLVGGAVFAFLVGMLLNWIGNLMYRIPSVEATSASTLAGCVVMFVPYISLLFLGVVAFGLMVSVGVSLAMNVAVATGRQRGRGDDVGLWHPARRSLVNSR